MRCIVVAKGKYLTPRRSTDVMYESRSKWSDDLEDAKVFQSRGAATRSARDNLGNDGVFDIFSVALTLGARL